MSINREIRFQTSGNKDSVTQVFYNNLYADSEPVKTTFSTVLKPKFTTYGGTLNYLTQDPYAIFTNLIRPPVRFVFSANTSALTGDSYFIHNIYRLDYETFKLYGDNQIDSNILVSNKKNADGTIGSVPQINKEYINQANKINGNNIIIQPEKFFGQPLTRNDLATIQSFLSNPILTLTASTSAITGNIYDLYLDQYIKQGGRFKTELFLDKSQYFIDTHLITFAKINKNYSEFTSLKNNLLTNTPWDNNIQLTSTNSYPYTIKNGLFSGITLSGNYFTYFTVPDKPVLEYPIMTGTLTTFTPEFRWSNGDNADSFLIQIDYNLSNTGFTGVSTFNYPVEKNEKNTKISRSRIKGPSSEFESEKSIYTFQIPIKSNSGFIYRVGNSKELIDLFGIRRNVITFTDYFSATTQQEPIKIYVQTETDSPFVSEISGFLTPPSLDFESPIGSFILSGIVSGSTVTGATIQLNYPNGSFIVGSTDLSGFYSFSGLGSGSYIMTTNYRGYQQDVRTINVSGNTAENFKIKLMWSNNVDTWGKLSGENYYT